MFREQRGTEDVTIAKPRMDSQVIGPHVVQVERAPVTLHDRINDVHGKFEYQWVCKYCGEKGVHLEGFDRMGHDCDGFEWLGSEQVARE